MKIVIGGQNIDVPQFMADAMKKPGNDRQFHIFLRQVLTAQAEKVRGNLTKAQQFDGISMLEEMTGLVSGLKKRK
jgi:hypothetical protein